MPRRPTDMESDIPLYLVPHVVMRGIRQFGREIDSIFIRKTGRHYYNIGVRSRPIRKELGSALYREELVTAVNIDDGGDRV